MRVLCMKLIMGRALGDVNLQFCTYAMYIRYKGKVKHNGHRSLKYGCEHRLDVCLM